MSIKDVEDGLKRNQPGLGDPQKVLEVTLGCAPEDICENVIITPFMHLKIFRRHVDGGSVKELAPDFFFQGFSSTYKGAGISVIRTGVGPSRVGDCLSILSMTPARNVIFAGAVGALTGDYEIGDLFLPLEAANGEGFTCYLENPFEKVVEEASVTRCSGGLEEELASFLVDSGHPPKEGRVFTIGSIAAESGENLRHLVEVGFDAIEMELSAFYKATAHHGFKSAALTYISDLPLASSLWDEKSLDEKERLTAAYRLLPTLALDFFASRAGDAR